MRRREYNRLKVEAFAFGIPPGNPVQGNAETSSFISYCGNTEVDIPMKIKWLTPSLLALCVVATGGLRAKATPAHPLPTAAQYQDQDRDWDRAPDSYQDAQRRGFHEGMEAARRDFADHRHADADDHQVYKHPPVDERDRGAFREGFKEGYRRAMDHMKHDRDRDNPYR